MGGKSLFRLQEDFAYLDALSRKRVLTDEESRRLENVINCLDARPVRTEIQARGRGFWWTVPEDETLKAKRADGLSFSQIARVVGRSKSSCISRYRSLTGKRSTRECST